MAEKNLPKVWTGFTPFGFLTGCMWEACDLQVVMGLPFLTMIVAVV